MPQKKHTIPKLIHDTALFAPNLKIKTNFIVTSIHSSVQNIKKYKECKLVVPLLNT